MRMVRILTGWIEIRPLHIRRQIRVPGSAGRGHRTPHRQMCGFQNLPTELFGHEYQNIQANSPLRKLCVDWLVFGIDPRSRFEGKKRDRYPTNILIDLSTANYELKKLIKPTEMAFRSTRSAYHVKSP